MDKINTKGIKTTRKMRPKKYEFKTIARNHSVQLVTLKNSNGKREKQGEQS